MTIKPGEAWGQTVEPPAGMIPVGGDAELARRLAALRDDPLAAPVLVTGGDLGRTVGAGQSGGALPATVNALPVDLLDVVLDGGVAHPACAHVIVHAPWKRGGWLRGPILVVMNAQFVGDWDVAPRAHPNDGRADVLEVASDLGVRQRVEARRRLPTARHLPHPGITSRSLRSGRWSFPAPMTVRIDGTPVGRARTIEVTVVADAAVLHA
jgi:hypothetical protein